MEGLLPFHNYKPLGGTRGQNIEHPHNLVILSSFFFCCFKCILVLLARHSSGELRCPATALIIPGSVVFMAQGGQET